MALSNNSQTSPNTIVSNFKIDHPIKSIETFGKGNVNDTFLVSTDSPEGDDYILQKLNRAVFSRPDWIIENQIAICNHIQSKQRHSKNLKIQDWKTPILIPVSTGQFYKKDKTDDLWRLTKYIPKTETLKQVEQKSDAYETGWALGFFHLLISDIPPSRLKTTIRHFHHTPVYLKNYEKIPPEVSNLKPSVESLFCHQFIRDRVDMVPVLESAKKDGLLNLRPIHGDPKIDNVLFSTSSRKAIGMIDLDTVSMGLLLYDIGDCLRSCCNLNGEEKATEEKVVFDLELAEAVLSGYFEAAAKILTSNDIKFLFEAVKLITFELGLRFFTDHLLGNRYFKTNYSRQNLDRAVIQFKLAESIETHELEFKALITELWGNV